MANTRFKNSRWLRADILGAQFLINLLGLALPIAILQIYDRVLKNQAVSTLVFLTAFLATILAVEFTLRVIQGLVRSAAASRYEHRKIISLSSVLLSGQSELGEKGTTAAVMDHYRSVQTVREFYFGSSVNVIVEIPFIAIYFAVMATIAGWLSLIPITIICIAGLISFGLSRRAVRLHRQQEDADRRRYDFLLEAFRGLITIKAAALENQILRRYERLENASAARLRQISKLAMSANNLSIVIASAATIIVVGCGSVLVVGGDMTLGGLAATTMLTGRSLQPIIRSLSITTRFQTARDAKKDLQEAVGASGAEHRLRQPVEAASQFILSDVSLMDEAGSDHFLEGQHLAVSPGELIAIKSNCQYNATSFLRLFNGTEAPDNGDVFVNGHPLPELDPAQLRRKVAYVGSDSELFNCTIKENVALFQDGPPFTRARKVLRALGTNQAIHRLPDGYNTQLDPTSRVISQGDRQAIAIARALSQEPDTLLLDEANKGMDQAQDKKLLQFLKSVKGRLTIVLTSERPSYLKLADRILEIDNGRIADITQEWREAHDRQDQPDGQDHPVGEQLARLTAEMSR